MCRLKFHPHLCMQCLFGSEESKAAKKETLVADVAGTLANVERLLPAGGFVNGGSKPTAADICLSDIVHSPFPGLKALEVPLGVLSLLEPETARGTLK